MNKLFFRLVLPLSLISYLLIDKWWYVKITDGDYSLMHGFPFINKSPSITSGGEIDYYILATTANISLHILFWLTIIFIIHKFVAPINVPSVLAIIFIIGLSLMFILFLLQEPYFSYALRYEIKIIDSGYQWGWEDKRCP